MFQVPDPVKSARPDGKVVQDTKEYYKKLGYQWSLPLLSDKDNKLAEGYQIAFYPGTRSEVWVNEIGGRYECILMLKPKI